MSVPNAADRAATDARRAWVIGGSLLIASAVLTVVSQPSTFQLPGSGLVASALFSIALLLFAFGLRRSGSVVARRPLGIAALVVLAAWTLIEPFIGRLLVPSDFGTNPSAVMWPSITLGYLDVIVRFLAAIIAATQVARAGVVPVPWNWAPTWVVFALALPWVLEQVVPFGSATEPGPIGAVIALDNLVRFAGPVFLGVLAIILANISGRTRTTPIPVDEVRD